MAADASFINPYTFTPFPDVQGDSFRRPPAGHARLAAERYLGQVQVTLTARSPLMVRGGPDTSQTFPRRRFPGTADVVPYIPGSALAGTVRSLHESIAGGCLRVFNAEFLPSYRDLVKPLEQDGRNPQWRLGVVEAVKNDRPARLRLCVPRRVRVSGDVLAEKLGDVAKVRTGAKLFVDLRGADAPSPDEFDTIRIGADHAQRVERGTSWVVLVTDSIQSEIPKRPKERRSYSCAVGELAGQVEWRESWNSAWTTFVGRVQESEDLQPRNEGVPDQVKVIHHGKTVGFRQKARTKAFEGQVLWVRYREEEPDNIDFSLAEIWRHSGAIAAGERIPPELSSCAGDPALGLCPTCRILGSADISSSQGRDADDFEARQHSYRGHVRFSDARPVGTGPKLTHRKLPRMDRPRPGAGQFTWKRAGANRV